MATTKINAQQTSFQDGWIKAGETWAYASASTITVPSGAASKYAIGDRIKWTQTTVKYGVVVAVADTLLTIAVNTDYVVADAAITLNYYSHELNPVGYPHWFNWTPTFAGWSSAPSLNWAYFRIDGRSLFFKIDIAATTSNNATHTFTVPIAVSNYPYGIAVTSDNGSSVTSPSKWTGSPASATLTLYKDWANNVWTASGTSSFSINDGNVKF